ncbi:MAG: 4-(cytidine 5'-diphospho)-2-C-methyl-D-erythritol kinase [Rhodocyclaceae bacterium]
MSVRQLRCPAPAKVNLFLHVTGRRADGYHTLETAFQLIDVGDEITLDVREDGRIVRASELADVPAEQDLVVRAARLLQDRTGTRLGVDIRVDKRLPMGGGLGGGSSDAASVMLGLNRLWGLGVSRATLQHWGLTLGADVPFFLFGRTALAGGVGEALIAVAAPAAWYVVVVPPVMVPTPKIFSAQDLTRDTEVRIMPGFAAQPVFDELAASGQNDLQPVACGLFPAVRAALDDLREASDGRAMFGARMSGSGACVFAAFAQQADAEAVAGILRSHWKVMVAQALDCHPLRDFAND